MSIGQAIKMIREPRAINVAQVIAYAIAAGSGVMAVLGVANPTFMASTIGPKMIMAVGIVLAAGGVTGAVSVITGLWWLERIALIITGTGWAMLLPAAVFFSLTGRSPAIWLIVALIVTALCDVFKRYRRIDWAYLDPTRS